MPKNKQKFRSEDTLPEQAYLKVSKKQKGKINADGNFGGKNRQLLDKDGNALDDVQAMREDQRLQGSQLHIVDEELAAAQNKQHGKQMQEDFVSKMKKHKRDNLEQDEAAHRARLKEKRLKKKRMHRDRDEDLEEAGDEEVGVQLATYSSENEAGHRSQSEESEREQHPPPKRQKVKGKTAEERALELLDEEF